MTRSGQERRIKDFKESKRVCKRKREKRFRERGREEERTCTEKLERKKGRREEGAHWKHNLTERESSRERKIGKEGDDK